MAQMVGDAPPNNAKAQDTDVFSRLEREIWTYPMRQQGYMYPRWFVVHLSLDDHTVREAFLMDDPQYVPKDGGRRR